MSDTPTSLPARRPRAYLIISITLALLAAAALLLWHGWKKPVVRLAEQAIREALPRGVEVGSVDLKFPTTIALKDVHQGNASADEIRVVFSPLTALRDGVASGVERVEVVRPVIELGSEFAGAPPAEWVERLAREAGELASQSGAGIAGPSFADVVVVITDGEVRAGDVKVVSGVRAVLTPGAGGLASVRVDRALVHFGGAPWALRGEYRPVASDDGKSVHQVKFSASRGESAIDIAGFAGAQSDIVITLSRVAPHELGRELFSSVGYAGIWEAAEGLGPATGTIRLQGAPSSLELEGRLAGSGGAGAPDEAWNIAIHGGGGEVAITGSGIPISLIARIAARAAGGAEPPSVEGEADFAMTLSGFASGRPQGVVDARLAGLAYGLIAAETGALSGRFEGTAADGTFELSLSLSGETSGEFDARGGWAGGAIAGSLAAPWANFGGFSLGEGALEFETGGGAGLLVSGGADAAGGRIELVDGRFGAGGFKGTFSTTAASAPGIVELLRALGVRFEGDRTMTGTVAGAVTVEYADGRTSVSGRLESARLGYRGIEFDRAAAEGSWSREAWEVRSLELASKSASLVLSLRAEDDRVAGKGTYEDVSSTARLEFAVDGRLSGEIRAFGTGTAGAGEVRVDAAWRPRERDVTVRGEVAGLPLSFLVGGEADVEGEASGPYLFTAEGGAWRASVDLALAGVSFRGATLQEGGLSLDLESPAASESASGTGPRSAGRRAPGGAACGGCLYGTARLWGELGLAGEPKTGALDASIQFDGSGGELRVKPIAAMGGEVAAGGSVRLRDGAWGLDLWSTGRGLRYKQEGLATRIDFQLGLQGPLVRPLLSGKVSLAEGEVDLLRLPRLAAAPRGPAPRRSPAIDVSLDVDVALERAAVAAGTFLAGEMAGAFELKGTVARPELYGEAALLRGDFRYLGSRFDATKGRVQFRGAAVPVLELSGTRAVRGTQVTTTLRGPVDNLELVLSSDPPLTQPEILELLNVPASVDLAEGWDELAWSLANVVSAEIVSQLYWRLGQSVEEALDLDQFRIDGARGSMRLTVGKQVSPKLYVIYSRSMGAEKEQGISAEYRLGPNMTLKSEWDFARRREIGIQLQAPF